MKYFLFLIVGFFTFCSTDAQPKDPIIWTYAAKKKTATTYDITITAKLPKPWHIYSQNTGDGGPVPTSVSFTKNPLVVLVNKVTEIGKVEKTYDENFKTNVLYYSNEVSFVQSIKLKVPVKTKLNGSIEYMVCNDELCLPPTKKSFSINVQ